MVKLLELEINNFLSIRHQRVDLSLDGIFYVYGNNLDTGGSNGSGKTAMFHDSIAWCLYGKTTRNATNDGLIQFGYESTKISIIFTMNGTLIKVIRSTTGKKLRILYDNVDKSLKNVADNQKIINDIFGTFSEFVSIGVLLSTPFLSVSSAARMEILSDLLNIRVLKDAKKNAAAEMSKLRIKNDTIDNLLIAEESKLKTISTTCLSQESIDILLDKKNLYANKVHKLNQKLKAINIKSAELQKNLYSKKRELDKYTYSMDSGTCYYCKSPITQEIIDTVYLLKNDIKDITQDIELVDRKYEVLAHKRTALNEKINDINKTLNENEIKYIRSDDVESNILKFKSEIEINKEESQYYEFWNNAFPAIRNIFIEKTIDTLNRIINQYINCISFNKSIKLKLSNNKIDVLVDDLDFGFCSKGESQIIDLIVRLAMSSFYRNSRQIDILIVDDAFGYLDDIGKDLVSKLISFINVNTCFIITPGIYDDKTLSIIVEKQNNETFLKKV